MAGTEHSLERSIVAPTEAWPAPTAHGPLDAVIHLPGSKSLTNRELLLAALADAPGTLRRPLHSRDSALMVDALRTLGAGIEQKAGSGAFGPDLLVTPAPLSGNSTVDCGLAGTVMRFVPIVAALADGPVTFDGDEHARLRPMSATITSLRALGVRVDDDDRGTLPFTVHGTGSVEGGELDIDASASSQFVSALLLAAPHFTHGLTLRHTGSRLPSLPHIDMTLDALRQRGVDATSVDHGVWRVAPGPISARDVTIEPDLSNAAPFLAAPLVAGGRVTVADWPAHSTQVGAELPGILERFGATATHDGDRCAVSHPGFTKQALAGGDLDLSHAGELSPTFVALGAFADAPLSIHGIAHTRGHETDRIEAMTDNLAALGGAASGDAPFVVEPAALHAGEWRAFADHRIATSGALIGLVVPGVTIDDIDATAKTIPEFPELWRAMLDGDRAPR